MLRFCVCVCRTSCRGPRVVSCLPPLYPIQKCNITSCAVAVPDFMPATLQSCFPVCVCRRSIKRHCLFTILVKIDWPGLIYNIGPASVHWLARAYLQYWSCFCALTGQGLFTILVLPLCIDWPGLIYNIGPASVHWLAGAHIYDEQSKLKADSPLLWFAEDAISLALSLHTHESPIASEIAVSSCLFLDWEIP